MICGECIYFGYLGRCRNPSVRSSERGYLEAACNKYEPRQHNMEQSTKLCKRCGRELPLDAFNKQTSRPDGLQANCRECQAEMAKNRREKKKGVGLSPDVGLPPRSVASQVADVLRPLPPFDVIEDALHNASDELLIDELRERGYTGKLSKLITVELD